jgi:phosphatidylinositol alpha-mannosyltransferase
MVCPYDLSVPGGVQAQVSGLAEALQREGVSVTVVAPAANGEAPPDGCGFIRVGRSVRIAVNGSLAPVAPGPVAMARTVAGLRRLRPDVVHVHEPFVPGSSLAALATGTHPIVGTFHRAGSDVVYRGAGVLLGPLARRIDAAVAVSEAARATALHVLGRRLEIRSVIPNAVDLRHFENLRPTTADGSPTPDSDGRADPLRIVFVGRHEERKGLVVLLEAFRLLRAPGFGPAQPCRLLVVGAGPETGRLIERYGADDSVEWLGAVDDAEKARLLGRADVFVAPSIRGESFGVVLLEAMAAGAPVIASDLPGYRLAAGDAAVLVPAGDAGALAGALASVLGDRSERERLAGLGGERVRGFSMDAIAERYQQLYASLLARRP